MPSAYCICLPCSKIRLKMILAERLAPRILAKVTLWWLSTGMQTMCNNACDVQCVPQALQFLCTVSLRQLVHGCFQLPQSCKATCCKPYGKRVFLLQTAARALCTAYARGISAPMQITRKSMTSTQGALCFSHCKVQIIGKDLLSATLHTAAPCLHVIPITNTA